ncbi:MAG TPA: 2-oxoglutarate and iron-dependent oxygenase domain-containing protein [Burkholderiaceae bacterium]|nr:2-oxoglutarate and iron-dependent oxygenase domain-containing protein [Burkholderiaceae bacterium]
MNEPTTLPCIDVAPLRDARAPDEARRAVARQLDAAARRHGFFYAVNHGVEVALIERLAAQARTFFAQDDATKLRIPMAAGGTAWRGYFAAGGELTSNRPDWKEGLYLGSELPPDHPRVRDGVILHGANLWPEIAGFRDTVLAYIDALTQLGHALMRGFALSLQLPDHWFAEHGTADPLILLRLFNYPARAVPKDIDAGWGVGEHTDYGLLTLLWQDDVGGLQVRDGERWIDAPPLPGSFVCNVGDMLDRMTGGRWRSLPHRVGLNTTGRDRLSIPLFFDPDFDARIVPVPGALVGADDSNRRWDGANLHAFEGTYGDYVSAKIGRVFPQLKQAVARGGP